MRITLIGLLLLAMSGCAAFSDDAGGTDTSDGVQVTAAFYPLQYAAQRVAGDHATVVNLTKPGGEPHDLELTVNETATIAEADLVVHEEGFQPAVDVGIKENAGGEVLDAATVVNLMDVEESAEEHEEHSDEGDEHADEEEHEHGDLDPHFWQDPLRMADLGDAVAERLAEIDPDHADDYNANAGDLRADLEALDSAYTEGLADCDRDAVVVSHDAFGYLEKYGLHLTGVAGLSPDAEPTPATLADLHELIRDEGITTVFSERLASPRFTEPLATDLGIRTAVLDPLEGLTDETTGEDYLSLMEQNLDALREANGCR
ncbi:MAG: metal ABC transporter substrate-binding protein [Actinomycetota bacterium]|nr:metal ABC transporter substrate-binding protein [Actinomycetota bacterium]